MNDNFKKFILIVLNIGKVVNIITYMNKFSDLIIYIYFFFVCNTR